MLYKALRLRSIIMETLQWFFHDQHPGYVIGDQKNEDHRDSNSVRKKPRLIAARYASTEVVNGKYFDSYKQNRVTECIRQESIRLG